MTHTITAAAYDGDIASRLRNWRGLHLAHSGRLFEEAADAIERLRGDAVVARLRLDAAHADMERLWNSDRSQPINPAADTPTTHTTPGEGSVQDRCKLTAEEREALHHVVGDVADITGPVEDILRNLLERLSTK